MTVIGLKGLTGLGSPAKQLLLLRRQTSLLDFLCLEDFRRWLFVCLFVCPFQPDLNEKSV